MAIAKCRCSNPWQDDKYGTGMRVHNKINKPGVVNDYRCASCGISVRSITSVTQARRLPGEVSVSAKSSNGGSGKKSKKKGKKQR